MAGIGFRYPPPTDGKPFRLMMGLRAMPSAAWLEVDADLEQQLPERQELIHHQRDRIFALLPGFDEPVAEFAKLITLNLATFHNHVYEVTNSDQITHLPTGSSVRLLDDHPFIQLARVIGEDLCLISKVDDEWKLTTAVVVYPSRWVLSEKLGKNLDQIHQPVPHYGSTLQPAMSMTFDKLTADRQVWRLNWALHADNDLHQPTATALSEQPDKYWWRTERQTLTKLPNSDHVLFTIRNRAEPLNNLTQDAAAAAAFAQTLNSMSPETIAYKGLTDDHRAIVDYLMSRNI